MKIDTNLAAPVNAQAWALGTVNKQGRMHVRSIVWGRLLARAERRPDEVIRRAVIMIRREPRS